MTENRSEKLMVQRIIKKVDDNDQFLNAFHYLMAKSLRKNPKKITYAHARRFILSSKFSKKMQGLGMVVDELVFSDKTLRVRLSNEEGDFIVNMKLKHGIPQMLQVWKIQYFLEYSVKKNDAY